jgi:hypothetical protein
MHEMAEESAERSPERIAFLNKVASHFIGVLQETLYDDVLLHLTRLTDPPSSGKYDHLSLQALPERVPEAALASELKGLIQAAEKAC